MPSLQCVRSTNKFLIDSQFECNSQQQPTKKKELTVCLENLFFARYQKFHIDPLYYLNFHIQYPFFISNKTKEYYCVVLEMQAGIGNIRNKAHILITLSRSFDDVVVVSLTLLILML
ncbi:hypothetical protein ISN45_Aa04g011310 [Arabidopsis thaliana x Arabidopsis arenosa]|uniref:Uncharacterized protein n=1 Tax=Arabidopsis thaliana x Arabidopsis arenosa TaxID=1240361 RepID=A0A8T2A6P4_9BRAS|nr:hypothetical protein ISN45_Aa04g011310 [Arabidopsis thaliana x Arabidopsis arenosa]